MEEFIMSKTRWATVSLLSVALFQFGSIAWAQVLADANGQYPAPRFPSTAKIGKSVDELMPYARALSRSKTTQRGAGFGDVKSGEAVILMVANNDDPMVIDALRRALEERGVKPLVFHSYDLAGVSKADFDALVAARGPGFGGGGAFGADPNSREPAQKNGSNEGVNWVRGLGRNGEGMAWLKKQNPELYNRAFPTRPAQAAPPALPAHLQEVAAKLAAVGGQEATGQALVKYMQAHPEVRGVFWGGAIAFTQRNLAPMQDKMLGSFVAYSTRYGMMNNFNTYPDDLWLLEEQMIMEPFAFVDKVTVTDPEGTDLSFDVTPEQAAKWAAGGYIRSHVLLHPDQVGGRYPTSFVDFPVTEKDWVPIEPRVKVNGVIAGTMGHGGYYPRIEMHYKDGTMVETRGGGLYGDIQREFLKYPGINTLTYPYMQMPGYWHLFEIATGTHPKAFRDPDNFTPPPAAADGLRELDRSGVFHYGLGAEMIEEPDVRGNPHKFWAFADDHNLPRGHGWHIHNYFPTYKVHVRNTDRWITLVDKGHQMDLDSPEVRALASRYGDPDQLLAVEWVPEIPGINAPGKYEDYAKDPWTYSKSVIDKAKAGIYEHFFPPLPAKQMAQSK
jgi:hypothetical protein